MIERLSRGFVMINSWWRASVVVGRRPSRRLTLRAPSPSGQQDAVARVGGQLAQRRGADLLQQRLHRYGLGQTRNTEPMIAVGRGILCETRQSVTETAIMA